MAEFRGLDFYRLDDLLSEEEKLARQSVRSFVEDNIIPIIEDCYEKADPVPSRETAR
jgi:glutaryl-CoA dehydrogenase